MNTTHTPANPAAKKRAPRKQFKPIEANTAALLSHIARRRKPITEAQLRTAGLPSMHPSAMNTLVRNGFLIETRIAATATEPKASAYTITPKGRESLKLRREWLSKRLVEATTPKAQAKSESETESEAATEGDGNPKQYPIEFAVAKPRTFYTGIGDYSDAEMRRNPYRAPTVVAQEIMHRTSKNYGLQTA